MFAGLKRRFPFLVNSTYASATAGSNILLLVLLIVAGRTLSLDDFGRFQFALAFTTIAETLMDIGLSPVTTRTVARNRDGAASFFRDVLGLKLAWVALGLIVIGVGAPLLRTDPVVVRLCYLMGLSTAARSYFLTTRGLLQGLDRFDLEALLVVADRVLLLASGAGALVGGLGLYGLAGAFVLSRALLLVVVLVMTRRFLGPIAPRLDIRAWRTLNAAALPLGLWLIALNAYNYIDAVILGVMRSNAEVGWYSAAYRLYEGLTYAPLVLSSVLTPSLSSAFLTDRVAHRRRLFRTLGGSIALGIVLGGLLYLLSGWLLTFIFGAEYAPAVAPLRILAGGSLFVFASWILNAGAVSIDLDRRLLGTTILGLAANVAINLALIPRFGMTGAAWATVVAEALTAGALFIQIHQKLGAPPGGAPLSAREPS